MIKLLKKHFFWIMLVFLVFVYSLITQKYLESLAIILASVGIYIIFIVFAKFVLFVISSFELIKQKKKLGKNFYSYSIIYLTILSLLIYFKFYSTLISIAVPTIVLVTIALLRKNRV